MDARRAPHGMREATALPVEDFAMPSRFTGLNLLSAALVPAILASACPAGGTVTQELAAADVSTTATTGTLQIQDALLSPKVSRPRRPDTTIDTVVVHFVSDVMENPDNPYQPGRVRDIFHKFKVSAHYLIGRDGTVYRLVPEDRSAFHAGGGKLPRDPSRQTNMNEYSIGIEILAVGSKKDMEIYKDLDYGKFAREHPDMVGFTPQQYASLNQLLDQLTRKYPAIKRDRGHIVGHSEVDPKRKTDPGELFDWTKIGL